MFGRHRGDVVLPVTVTGQEPPTSQQPGLYVTSSRDLRAGEIILKVVNSAGESVASDVRIEGVKKIASKGTQIVLASEKLTDENSIAEPKKVAPVVLSLKGASAAFKHTFPAYSVTVLRLKAGR